MQQTLNKLRASLIPIYGEGETEAIIRLIFHHLKGWNLTDMLIHRQDELSPFIKEEVDKILARLLDGEPIQYITGEARFHGMDMLIKPGVLIPRPETAELVDLIIDQNKSREDLRILDICTGSGCIAIALARNLPFANVSALDFSKDALDVAQDNARMLKVKLNLIHKDIFSWIPNEEYDIIVSNPPYIMDKESVSMERNVLDFEPHEALFVRDDDPLIFYKRIADIAKKYLTPGGKLYFETNPLTVNNLKEILIKDGFEEIEILRDSYGKFRFLYCQKQKK